MSNIFNNPVWPNGMQTDDEGYAVFYPLGTNKIPIPTTASDWPEGSKLIFPFVYDENDELVDFCDTKAMEIDNNNTVIDMPYTDIKADFSSIIEGTLTINTPSDSNVEIKWGSVDTVLTEKIEKVVGRGNCKVSFDKVANKATVALAYEITETQLVEVESLLNRDLPNNIVTEFDPFPCDFTKVEYLENSDSNTFVQIDNVYYIDEAELDISPINASHHVIYGAQQNKYRQSIAIRDGVFTVCPGDSNTGEYTSRVNCIPGERVKIKANYKNVTCFINGEQKALKCMFTISKATEDMPQRTSYLGLKMKNYGAKLVWGENEIALVPALDLTGAPCMFDTVSRTPFYCAGSGDFMYPGAEQAVQTLDLDWDTKSYAKLTEHGVRRLYHVPKGYTDSMDKYAAENGFKELIEPPAPLEGYWMPVWRETETQLICGWVETEPPVEEEIINN